MKKYNLILIMFFPIMIFLGQEKFVGVKSSEVVQADKNRCLKYRRVNNNLKEKLAVVTLEKVQHHLKLQIS